MSKLTLQVHVKWIQTVGGGVGEGRKKEGEGIIPLQVFWINTSISALVL